MPVHSIIIPYQKSKDVAFAKCVEDRLLQIFKLPLPQTVYLVFPGNPESPPNPQFSEYSTFLTFSTIRNIPKGCKLITKYTGYTPICNPRSATGGFITFENEVKVEGTLEVQTNCTIKFITGGEVSVDGTVKLCAFSTIIIGEEASASKFLNAGTFSIASPHIPPKNQNGIPGTSLFLYTCDFINVGTLRLGCTPARYARPFLPTNNCVSIKWPSCNQTVGNNLNLNADSSFKDENPSPQRGKFSKITLFNNNTTAELSDLSINPIIYSVIPSPTIFNGCKSIGAGRTILFKDHHQSEDFFNILRCATNQSLHIIIEERSDPITINQCTVIPSGTLIDFRPNSMGLVINDRLTIHGFIQLQNEGDKLFQIIVNEQGKMFQSAASQCNFRNKFDDKSANIKIINHGLIRIGSYFGIFANSGKVDFINYNTGTVDITQSSFNANRETIFDGCFIKFAGFLNIFNVNFVNHGKMRITGVPLNQEVWARWFTISYYPGFANGENPIVKDAPVPTFLNTGTIEVSDGAQFCINKAGQYTSNNGTLTLTRQAYVGAGIMTLENHSQLSICGPSFNYSNEQIPGAVQLNNTVMGVEMDETCCVFQSTNSQNPIPVTIKKK